LRAVESEDTATVPWQGQPDPAREKPIVLPPQAHLHIRGGNPPLLASRNGPFAIDVVPNRGAQQDRPFMGDDDLRSTMTVLPVIDLRDGKTVGRFAWKTPVWTRARLSPDGMFVVGPDNSEKARITAKDGTLFVWQREKVAPVATFTVPGPVLWLDFVANDRLALLTLADTPVLQVWNIPAGKLEKSIPLPNGEFSPPYADPFTYMKREPDSKTYAPESWIGAVGPGGAMVVLGGKTAVHAISLTQGKVVGALPIPWKRILYGTQIGGHTHNGFAFSADGAELKGLLQAGEIRMGQQLKPTQVWLLSWSLKTGMCERATPIGSGGPEQMFRGSPMPGPVADTMLLPYRDFAQKDSKQLMGLDGRALSTGAAVHARTGAILSLVNLLPLRINGEGLLSYGALVYGPELPPPEYLKGIRLTDQNKAAMLAVYVSRVNGDEVSKQIAAQPKITPRPEVMPGDRIGLTASKPTPPSTWSRPPAPPQPTPGLKVALNVPNSPPLFGDAVVGLISSFAQVPDSKLIAELRPKAQTRDAAAAKKLEEIYKFPDGIHWHRYDLRTGKPVSPPIELWPWATSPTTGKAMDFAQIPSVAAMTSDGQKLPCAIRPMTPAPIFGAATGSAWPASSPTGPERPCNGWAGRPEACCSRSATGSSPAGKSPHAKQSSR
jgi:hypothetical protein